MNDRYWLGTAMKRHGGSFVSRLGDALLHADAANEQRIRIHFADLIAKYLPIAEKLKQEDAQKP